MNPLHPASHPKPIRPPRRKRGKQLETADARAGVQALNKLGVGFFYRVKNMGTYDPVRGFFRKDLSKDFVAIPDVCGYRTKPPLLGVYIEWKHVHGLDKKRKLIFKVKITDKQKEFLYGAHRAGHLAGVAFNLDDAIAIAMNDPARFVRHPRTYLFLPDSEHEIVIARYHEQKKALSKLKQDPVAAATYLAHGVSGNPQEPEDWEKL